VVVPPVDVGASPLDVLDVLEEAVVSLDVLDVLDVLDEAVLSLVDDSVSAGFVGPHASTTTTAPPHQDLRALRCILIT
jgi:hypothetical protein